MSKPQEDERWMAIALEEARQGLGLTAPNPAVGCVIVKDGQELARGWHRKSGLPHAERDALAKLTSEDTKGAILYVTLEPCSTKGKTGACTDAIIQAGIQRVAYGASDPNPAHAGAADAILSAAGIEVISGVLEEECLSLIRGFAMVQRSGRPWVIAKTAMSLDGRITRPPGEGQWLTGPQAREEVQHIRAEVDGIITSGETVRRDDPALTLRSKTIKSDKEQPIRIVLTRTGIESGTYQIFNDQFSAQTRVFQNQPLEDVLQTLAADGLHTVLLECGGSLMGAFLDEGLIDELVVFYAPIVTGGPSPGIGGEGAEGLENRLGMKNPVIKQLGPDLCIRGLVERQPTFALER